jgi:prepilin-type N-terminal cleavage/methylation domain-containing protein
MFFLLNKRKRNPTRGFSLVEMMVAVALFAVVMTISVGSLLSLVNADKKAQALKSVMNNLNFALENMSRNMRVGTSYHCSTSASVPADTTTPNDCINGGVLVAFEGHAGDPADSSDQIIYRFTSGRIEKSENGGGSFIAITAPEVTINEMKFYVTGTTAGDTEQPRIVMTISGSAGIKDATETSFNLQTTISQRLTDI